MGEIRHTIVVAWTDEDYIPDGRPYARDLGGRPSMRKVKIGKALVWLNKGKTADIENARAYAARHEAATGKVFVYPTSEPDPLGCGRRDIIAGRSGR